MTSKEPAPASFSVVIPMKPLRAAKSRLNVTPTTRHGLVRAMFTDTPTGVLRSDRVASVLVVTGDPTLAEVAELHGAQAVPEPQSGGLNQALMRGWSRARAVAPSDAVVLMLGDLPGIETEDLEDLLETFTHQPSPTLVADRAGTGTTMLVVPAGVRPVLAFGPGSSERHRQLGYVDALNECPSLRHDVDQVSDLEEVLASATRASCTRWAVASLYQGVCRTDR